MESRATLRSTEYCEEKATIRMEKGSTNHTLVKSSANLHQCISSMLCLNYLSV